MKRLVIIAALIIAAIASMKAQSGNGYNLSPVATDSLTIMLSHLAATNSEVAYLNETLRLHSQIALGSFVLEGIGAACILASSSYFSGDFADLDAKAKTGVCLCIAGGIGFICSYIPIWTNKVRMDGRGLIIQP